MGSASLIHPFSTTGLSQKLYRKPSSRSLLMTGNSKYTEQDHKSRRIPVTRPYVAFAAGSLLLAFAAAPLFAESINPPTTPQTAPMTAQEKKNLDMVLNWWREVLDGGRSEEHTSELQSLRHL